MTLLPLLLALSASANAPEEAPRYLLGDVGVRLNVDSEHLTDVEWTDRSFHATETLDRGALVELSAWSTPFQVIPAEADLDAWVDVYRRQAALVVTDGAFTVTHKAIGKRHGQPTVEVELAYTSEKWGPGTILASGLPVEGQLLHVSAVAGSKHDRAMRVEHERIMDSLDVQSAPAPVTWGGDTIATGVSAHLPGDGWRVPLAVERDHVVGDLKSRFQMAVTADCAVAIHPYAGGTADYLFTCPEERRLGVVDEYTFSDVETELRTSMFGQAADKIGAGEALHLDDRSGVLFDLPMPGQTMFVGVVPYDHGVARTTVVGAENAHDRLSSDIRAVMVGATYSGPHPVELGEQVGYWLGYRPLSPVVLLPGLGLIVLVGGFLVLVLGVATIASRKQHAFDDLDTY